MKFSLSFITLAVLALGTDAFPHPPVGGKCTIICPASYVCVTSDKGHNFCAKASRSAPRELPGEMFKRHFACRKNGERCQNSKQCCKGYCFDLTSTCVNH